MLRSFCLFGPQILGHTFVDLARPWELVDARPGSAPGFGRCLSLLGPPGGSSPASRST